MKWKLIIFSFFILGNICFSWWVLKRNDKLKELIDIHIKTIQHQTEIITTQETISDMYLSIIKYRDSNPLIDITRYAKKNKKESRKEKVYGQGGE